MKTGYNFQTFCLLTAFCLSLYRFPDVIVFGFFKGFDSNWLGDDFESYQLFQVAPTFAVAATVVQHQFTHDEKGFGSESTKEKVAERVVSEITRK